MRQPLGGILGECTLWFSFQKNEHLTMNPALPFNLDVPLLTPWVNPLNGLLGWKVEKWAASGNASNVLHSLGLMARVALWVIEHLSFLERVATSSRVNAGSPQSHSSSHRISDWTFVFCAGCIPVLHPSDQQVYACIINASCPITEWLAPF